MQEKLIESWLDSASEKSYQPVFCQMLTRQGYTVIHSTRHCPIEYGKDILAIAPDGQPCAFQLKGNPSGRLNLTQYRQIEPQLREMIHQRIEHPAITGNQPHRSFLVTNGDIEEEVQQAIVQANETNARDGYPHRKLETISRGELLKWAYALEDSLWPSELKDIQHLLEILTRKGDELFPVKTFHNLLCGLLRLGFDAEDEKVSTEDFKRRVASGCLLTSVALKAFSEKDNHWAVVTAWTMLSVYLIAAHEKHQKNVNLIEEALQLAEEAIFKETALLVTETVDRDRPLVEGNPIADFAVYPWRYTLLVGICSFFWLWAQQTNDWPEGDFKAKLEAFLPDNQDKMDLWGESALPLFLTHAWYMFAKGDSPPADGLVDQLMERVLETPLYPVYFPAEDVIRQRLSESLTAFVPPIDFKLEEKVETSSFALQLMLHMVQRGLKDRCKAHWPRYSKVASVSFLPETPWMFCLFRSEKGVNHQNISPVTGEWEKLEAMAAENPAQFIPKALLNRPFLLWLWCIISPHRAITASMLHVFHCLPVQQAEAVPAVEAQGT